jgi:hypothetical protein
VPPNEALSGQRQGKKHRHHQETVVPTPRSASEPQFGSPPKAPGAGEVDLLGGFGGQPPQRTSAADIDLLVGFGGTQQPLFVAQGQRRQPQSTGGAVTLDPFGGFGAAPGPHPRGFVQPQPQPQRRQPQSTGGSVDLDPFLGFDAAPAQQRQRAANDRAALKALVESAPTGPGSGASLRDMLGGGGNVGRPAAQPLGGMAARGPVRPAADPFRFPF